MIAASPARRDRGAGRLATLRRNARTLGPRWLITQILLTALAVLLILFVLLPVVRWVFYGADWGVVAANLRLYAIGRYPSDQAWRVVLCVAATAVLAGLSAALLGKVARDAAVLFGGCLGALAAMPVVGAIVSSDLVAGIFEIPLVQAVVGPLPESSLWDVALALRPAMPVFVALLVALGPGALAGRAWSRRTLGHGPATGLGGGPATGRGRAAARSPKRILGWAWMLLLPASLLALRGVGQTLRGGGSSGVGGAGDSDVFALVPAADWGGLLLTVVLSMAALAAAFPFGVLLALGRRSSLPLVRGTSIVYIELVRGVPLVTILFMTQIMLPMVVPEGPWLDRVFRAMVGLALFTAAYVAEDVRGGLAAIGTGQMEAARAVGLGSAGTYRLVILPQALRVVVPSLVGQFISLFKDTSLTQIVGLNELLGIAVAVVAQKEWLGRAPESLLFAASVYFVFCHAMVRVSRNLERPQSGSPSEMSGRLRA